LEEQALTSELQRKAMTKLIGLQYTIKYKKNGWIIRQQMLCHALAMYMLFLWHNQSGYKRF
jgi:hypothetical protein